MYKLTSNPLPEHAEVPLADDGRWEAMVATWTDRGAHRVAPEGPQHGNADYVVSVGPERDDVARNAQLAEITSLVQHQGDRVVGHEIRHLSAPNPRTFLGKGTAREIAARAREAGADMLVLDAELSPSQTRNLEDEAQMPICDREAVILNVFLRNARTRAARIQVEIARLHYLRPRIRGVGLDMDQQTGATKNARGPGETASELMARKLDRRLEELEKAARRIGNSGEVQRKERSACARIALVGYTNTGKTSLMNALTHAELSARDMPFETLDTTSRCLTRHGGDVLVSDTVGFIRRLPARLLASFESTLSEVAQASLLALVVDASDPERDLHMTTTDGVLERLGVRGIPRFYVFNKVDRLDRRVGASTFAAWAAGHPWVSLSSHDAQAVEALRGRLVEHARGHHRTRVLFVRYALAGAAKEIYARCRVLESEATPHGLRLTVQGEAHVLERISKQLKESEQ